MSLLGQICGIRELSFTLNLLSFFVNLDKFCCDKHVRVLLIAYWPIPIRCTVLLLLLLDIFGHRIFPEVVTCCQLSAKQYILLPLKWSPLFIATRIVQLKKPSADLIQHVFVCTLLERTSSANAFILILNGHASFNVFFQIYNFNLTFKVFWIYLWLKF